MSITLRSRHFLEIRDWSVAELHEVLNSAALMKIQHKAGIRHRPLEGKTLGLLFRKPSTRTRVSFSVAIYQLGGMPLYLPGSELQLSRGETVADTARTLSRYVDGLAVRTHAHAEVEELARYGAVPVINALTAWQHPCQAMGDLLTIKEKKGRLEGIKLVYVGDGNNVAHSLIEAGARFGMHVVCACPPGYEPDALLVERSRADPGATGGRVEVLHDPLAAAADADVVYTDVWTSMGQEAEAAGRLQALAPFRVTADLMRRARPGALFMHCLPAHRGEEVLDEVMDGPWSVVWDQAENRLHIQKAILAAVLS